MLVFENVKGFPVTTKLGEYLRVKLNGSDLALAGAADAATTVGTINQAYEVTGLGATLVAPILLAGIGGVRRMIANSSFAAGVTVYTAAGGMIDDAVGGGSRFGIAITASSAQGDMVEVLELPAMQGGGNTTFTETYTFAAANVANVIFAAPAACSVVSATLTYGTAAGQAGALNIEKCNAGEGATAGDVILATNFDLYATTNTAQTILALATGVQNLVAGDQIRLKLISGAATTLAGATITLVLAWS